VAFLDTIFLLAPAKNLPPHRDGNGHINMELLHRGKRLRFQIVTQASGPQ
jgi:hypothetical protein